MDERVMQFRVGVMIFATLIITGIMVVMFGKFPEIIHGEKTVEMIFDSAPGVKKDTPVRKSGIRIGRVTKVDFAPDEEGRPDAVVVVTAAIRGARLYENDTCQVQTSLLGDAAIEFGRDPNSTAPPVELSNGARVHGRAPVDPGEAMRRLQESLDGSIQKVNGAAGKLGGAGAKLVDTLGRIDGVLDQNKDQFNKALTQATKTLESINKAATALADDDLQKDLRDSLKEMPGVLKAAGKTIDDIQVTMKKVDSSFANMQRFTEGLAEEETLAQIRDTTQKLDRIVTDLSQFSRKINSPTGSLGKLVHDPELYCRLNNAARNIDELTQQLKPIVSDARVFSDKIARHPELLGVRGAIQRNPGIK